jgi:membrane fusion protein, copper/silver efflux system
MKTCKVLLRIAFAILVIAGISACSKPSGTAADKNVDYYTCTMHPSVHSKTPGKCPICSMDLVPVIKKGTAEVAAKDSAQQGGGMGSMPMPSANQEANKSSEFSVPVERQQQIGVTFTTAERRPIQLSIRSVGFLEPDLGKMFEYVARVDGYVQDLKVTSPGERVAAGQPLLSVYSPDLRSSEQELVNLLNERDRGGSGHSNSLDALIESAKQRLRQWNVNQEEIDALEKSRKASDNLVLRSPFDGVVEDVPMKQGMSVKMGDRLVGVINLSGLWLWAQFYENDVGLLKVGQTLDISFTAFPGKKFQGQIGAIDPKLDAMTRTTRVRIDLKNPDGELRPGMFANAEVQIDRGEGLAVPMDAVLPTGSRGLVFVDKGSGKLEPRYVRTGRSFTQTDGTTDTTYEEVLDGLTEGERVVSSANFLIDAESRIQGALKTWQEPSEERSKKSSDEGKEEKPPQTESKPLSGETRPAFEAVLKAYNGIHDLLAKDQFDGVAAQAVALRGAIHQLVSSSPELMKQDSYRDAVTKMRRTAEGFDAHNLEDARAQFGFFSADLISFLKQFSAPTEQSLYTITCPMWKESPAQWIQASAEVKNPFLGIRIPDCGQVSGPLQAVK